MKRITLATFFTLTTATAYASMVPFEWKHEDEAIIQAAFEGRYLWQSNNLAEMESFDVNYHNGNPRRDQFTKLFPSLGANPEADFGYSADVAYMVPYTKKSWLEVRGSYTWINTGRDISDNLGAIVPVSDTSVVTKDASFNYDFKEAELMVGQTFLMNPAWMTKLSAGLVYVNIDQNGNSFDHMSHAFGTSVEAISTAANVQNKFAGLGPKIAMDNQLNFTRNLSLIGNVGASLLYGKSTTSINYNSHYSFDGVPTEFNAEGNEKKESNHLAVGLDAKLGGKVEYADEDNYAVALEAGYQITSYLNAMGGDDMTVDLTGSLEAYDPAGLLTSQESFDRNYYNYGPYVGLTVSFM